MTLHEIARAMFGMVPDVVIDGAMVPFLMQALWKLTEDRKVGFEPGDPVKRKWFAVTRRTTRPPRQFGSVARQ
jgi:hydrolase